MRGFIVKVGAASFVWLIPSLTFLPPAAAQTSSGAPQCGIQQAADTAVQRQLTLIDAAKTNTSDFFNGANSCISTELLSSIDLSQLIPDLSGFLTSAATQAFQQIIQKAKSQVCGIVNQQINNVIGQINSKLYQFQSTITGDLSSVLQGTFTPIKPPNIQGFGTFALNQPGAGASPVFTPVTLSQPATTPSTGTVVAPNTSTTTNGSSGGIDWGQVLYGR